MTSTKITQTATKKVDIKVALPKSPILVIIGTKTIKILKQSDIKKGYKRVCILPTGSSLFSNNTAVDSVDITQQTITDITIQSPGHRYSLHQTLLNFLDASWKYYNILIEHGQQHCVDEKGPDTSSIFKFKRDQIHSIQKTNSEGIRFSTFLVKDDDRAFGVLLQPFEMEVEVKPVLKKSSTRKRKHGKGITNTTPVTTRIPKKRKHNTNSRQQDNGQPSNNITIDSDEDMDMNTSNDNTNRTGNTSGHNNTVEHGEITEHGGNSELKHDDVPTSNNINNIPDITRSSVRNFAPNLPTLHPVYYHGNTITAPTIPSAYPNNTETKVDNENMVNNTQYRPVVELTAPMTRVNPPPASSQANTVATQQATSTQTNMATVASSNTISHPTHTSNINSGYLDTEQTVGNFLRTLRPQRRIQLGSVRFDIVSLLCFILQNDDSSQQFRRQLILHKADASVKSYNDLNLVRSCLPNMSKIYQIKLRILVILFHHVAIRARISLTTLTPALIRNLQDANNYSTATVCSSVRDTLNQLANLNQVSWLSFITLWSSNLQKNNIITVPAPEVNRARVNSNTVRSYQKPNNFNAFRPKPNSVYRDNGNRQSRYNRYNSYEQRQYNNGIRWRQNSNNHQQFRQRQYNNGSNKENRNTANIRYPHNNNTSFRPHPRSG